ncbi:hypothetical protein AU378_00400 [Chryseobacterium kwangjuense]|uniref:Uncharacterized protein n=1 Tax=Chryseobacterium kwangjuense TaxID=267125 RepID=A0A135WH69_9FLAO|nr:hypothetical protein AU378_00400 [Chryseobacterium kwangjuense]
MKHIFRADFRFHPISIPFYPSEFKFPAYTTRLSCFKSKRMCDILVFGYQSYEQSYEIKS